MSRLLPISTHHKPRATNSFGFTLVELLVAISIIAILSVIGLTIFAGVQKNARDAKRRGDVEAISKAIEAHYNTSSGYPVIDCATWFTGGTCPTDPTSNVRYSGDPNTAGFTYKVCADFEADGRGSDDTTAGNGANINDFCRSQQQ